MYSSTLDYAFSISDKKIELCKWVAHNTLDYTVKPECMIVNSKPGTLYKVELIYTKYYYIYVFSKD